MRGDSVHGVKLHVLELFAFRLHIMVSYLCTIERKIHGTSEHVALVCNKIGNFDFDHSFDITKCLQEIEISDLLHMYNDQLYDIEPWINIYLVL